MLVIKKINNNVAICLDSAGRELVAMGKGIGFPQVPYELTDMRKVDRTFYDINSQYFPLLNDIPSEVIQFTAEMMDRIRGQLPYTTNANIVITLADHIAFTIERAKKGIYIQMPSIHELEHGYPLEVRISRQFYSEIQKRFRIRLPQDEIQGITMHFINARNGTEEPSQAPANDLQRQFNEILEQTTSIIEQELNIHIQRDTFSYARFASHVQYLLQRLFTQQYDTNNLQAYVALRKEFPDAARCVDKIAAYYEENWSAQLTEEEKLYLIMHTNRICVKEGL